MPACTTPSKHKLLPHGLVRKTHSFGGRSHAIGSLFSKIRRKQTILSRQNLAEQHLTYERPAAPPAGLSQNGTLAAHLTTCHKLPAGKTLGRSGFRLMPKRVRRNPLTVA